MLETDPVSELKLESELTLRNPTCATPTCAVILERLFPTSELTVSVLSVRDVSPVIELTARVFAASELIVKMLEAVPTKEFTPMSELTLRPPICAARLERLFPISELTVSTPTCSLRLEILIPVNELTVSTPAWAVILDKLFPTSELIVAMLETDPVSELKLEIELTLRRPPICAVNVERLFPTSELSVSVLNVKDVIPTIELTARVFAASELIVKMLEADPTKEFTPTSELTLRRPPICAVNVERLFPINELTVSTPT
jgi:hypothetical protein